VGKHVKLTCKFLVQNYGDQSPIERCYGHVCIITYEA